jgi:hypothetical protein
MSVLLPKDRDRGLRIAKPVDGAKPGGQGAEFAQRFHQTPSSIHLLEGRSRESEGQGAVRPENPPPPDPDLTVRPLPTGEVNIRVT